MSKEILLIGSDPKTLVETTRKLAIEILPHFNGMSYFQIQEVLKKIDDLVKYNLPVSINVS